MATTHATMPLAAALSRPAAASATVNANGTGGHASNKDWSLPLDLVGELKNGQETLQQLLDRYNMPVKRVVSAVTPAPAAAAATSSTFMTALLNEPDARTANDAAAHSTTGDALVDLFWELGPTATQDTLTPLLESAWKKNPLDTLKIIWQARSIHEGKGIREHVFYHLIGFLYRHHPRTLFENLHLLTTKECTRSDLTADAGDGVNMLIERSGTPHGCFKDLLNILLLAVDGTLDGDVTVAALARAQNNGLDSNAFGKLIAPNRGGKVNASDKKRMYAKRSSNLAALPEWYKTYAAADSGAKHSMQRVRLKDALNEKPKVRAMYIVVCKLFAHTMEADLKIAEKLVGLPKDKAYEVSSQLSLAAKWAPTPGKALDKQLLVASGIAAALFPGIAGNVDRRMALQTKVLAPLRKALDVPEVKMAANKWEKIDYGRCASKCMARNKLNFLLHDEKKFLKYLEQVLQGRKKISGAVLFPHELLIEAMAPTMVLDAPARKKLPADKITELERALSSTVDAQWHSLVNSLKESSTGTLTNCIAVVDVSGSMGSLGIHMQKSPPFPITVAVAMGILTAQLAAPPFNGAFITFSAQPQIVKLKEGATLKQTAENMARSDWGMNTALDKVFDLILKLALENKIKKEEMIQKLFIFSDMQFDSACSDWGRPVGGTNKTPHQVVTERFQKAGYDLPKVVYWNIQGNEAFKGTAPARADQPGVELVSGYSAAIMKSFLRDAESEAEAAKEDEETKMATDDDDEFEDLGIEKKGKPDNGATEGKKEVTPAQKLAQVLANPAFAKLKVYD